MVMVEKNNVINYIYIQYIYIYVYIYILSYIYMYTGHKYIGLGVTGARRSVPGRRAGRGTPPLARGRGRGRSATPSTGSPANNMDFWWLKCCSSFISR
jgi:hypothetical protein